MFDQKSPQTSAEGNPESGVAVASRHESFAVIGSALFAFPLAHLRWMYTIGAGWWRNTSIEKCRSALRGML
jgi:hypothetical protein